MAGYKETPRQKMIGMMYLVLTALLALNVSKEILSAFVVVNESLEITNKNFEKKNELSYMNFEKQYKISPEKVKSFYLKSQQAKKYAQDMVDYINKLRVQLISKVEGIPESEAKKMQLKNVSAKDNYDIPTRMFMGESQDGSAGESKKLKDAIEKFKKDMLALLDPKYKDKVKLGLITDGKYEDASGESENWEQHTFYHIVTAASVVTLSKMITDIRNAEFDIVAQLYSSISLEDFKFDKIGAKIVPKSSYVITGDNFEADIFVAAYDTKQKPKILVGADVDTITNTIIGGVGESVEVIEGVGKYKVPAAGVGEKKFGGIINVPSPSGAIKSYCFKGIYNVAAPTATVSAEATKVFYIGLDNPVSISVPGVASENVMPSISGGGALLKQANGMYIVKNLPLGTKKCTISVSAKMGGGQKSMGVFPFKVKNVPDPLPSVAGKRGGGISKAVLAASPYVTADMDNFLFEGVKYTVVSFNFSAQIGGLLQEATCPGMMMNSGALASLSKAKSGSKIFFENIKARGPDGTTRTLPAVILKLM